MSEISTNKARLTIDGQIQEVEVVTVRKLNDKGGYDVEVHVPFVKLTSVKQGE